MSLAAYSLATLAELKAFRPIVGTDQDAEIERALARASLRIEEFLDRRLVYRAPGEDAQNDNILAETVLANGAVVPLAAPDATGRTLIVTVIDADHSLTAGTLTVTGTVNGVAGVTETFQLTAGNVLHGGKFFAGAVTLAVADLAGHDASDKIKIGSSQGYVEYHSPYPDTSEISLLEWPIQGVAEINEDLNLEYAAATALTEGTTFSVRQRRQIARVSNRLDFPWVAAHRAIRARYSGGYITSANVPATVKNVALELAYWIYRNATDGVVGFSSTTDAAGARTFTGPPVITQGMKDALCGGGYLRPELFDRTGERDFDLEAA